MFKKKLLSTWYFLFPLFVHILLCLYLFIIMLKLLNSECMYVDKTKIIKP